ncbi:NAD-dependent protein deacylase [Paenibacillus sp. J5C_2022]|uniref:NAD-dependent protein deacylase n=1 Tax=Paenibacillus sp. J5C2022 TaxID=2977129 RepID=UPI0021CF6EF9|nr:NAD-dependent protein deacylase [Paenibacillus sp. J5C2022]MCU6707951.1 NAD-dependent protein deacylase [Paenibacillus sp. J5C2022]
MLEPMVQWIQSSRNITVLSGAGISTASGLPDFRSRGGIYDNHLNVEAILSESYFYSKPKQFWVYFKEIFQFEQLEQYKPNPGHHFVRLLEDMGKSVTVVTQNIDGLHQQAGSSHVLEVHGTLNFACCPKCKRQYDRKHLMQEAIPRCTEDGFILKPEVVLFGGSVKHMEASFAAAYDADLFIAMGTSLQVSPVNGLPGYAARNRNSKMALINREPTSMDSLFDLVIHADIVDTVEQLQSRLSIS